MTAPKKSKPAAKPSAPAKTGGLPRKVRKEKADTPKRPKNS